MGACAWETPSEHFSLGQRGHADEAARAAEDPGARLRRPAGGSAVGVATSVTPIAVRPVRQKELTTELCSETACRTI